MPADGGLLQSIPAGLLVTVPLPAPVMFTFTVSCGEGAFTNPWHPAKISNEQARSTLRANFEPMRKSRVSTEFDEPRGELVGLAQPPVNAVIYRQTPVFLAVFAGCESGAWCYSGISPFDFSNQHLTS